MMFAIVFSFILFEIISIIAQIITLNFRFIVKYVSQIEDYANL